MTALSYKGELYHLIQTGLPNRRQLPKASTLLSLGGLGGPGCPSSWLPRRQATIQRNIARVATIAASASGVTKSQEVLKV